MGILDWFKDTEEEVEEEVKDTYDIKVLCLNCRYKGIISLKKGVDVKSIIGDFKCPKCDLNKLVHYSSAIETMFSEENSFDDLWDNVISHQIPEETIKFYNKEGNKKKDDKKNS